MTAHPARPLKIGFLPANRGFFSQKLARQARDQVLAVMAQVGIEAVVPDPQQTKEGCVETIAEAQLCAELFRNADVDGIFIGAVNFGDEQAAAWTIKQARLNVPILIWGSQETAALSLGMHRRDAFCGLLSIGDALRQVGARYTVAQTPISPPTDPSLAAELDFFRRVCRVVRGVREARYGQIGARPEAFWTCRFDERQLQQLGPTTVVMDLSELLEQVQQIKDDDQQVHAIIADIHQYADAGATTGPALLKMAKLELVLERWREQQQLSALAIQCWTSIQRNLGVCSCTTMSRLGDRLIPAACEADILGALSMHALVLASETPAALADWNNLHQDDPELVNLWHCGVFPKSFSNTRPKLSVHSILVASGATLAEQSQGVAELLVKPAPMTMARVTQDPQEGWKAVVAQGRTEDNTACTIGSYGWCRVKNLDRLYRQVLLRHFPHHVAIAQAHVGNVLWEAFGNYLGMKVYNAEQAASGVYAGERPF